MKSFSALNFKEKMEYIGILAIYPLILLYEQIGKSVKFLNSKSRQITASILTVCLMLTMIPLSAITVFAATGDVAQIGDETYASLSEAVTNASAGDTIVMLADDSTDQQITIDKNLTIDLMGFDLTKTRFKITGGNVVIRDSLGTGVINETHEDGIYASADTSFSYRSRVCSTISIHGTANVSLNNITVHYGAGDLKKAIYLGGSGASLTINGGSYYGYDSSGGNAIYFYDDEGSTLTINDGYFYGSECISVNKGNNILSQLHLVKAHLVSKNGPFWIQYGYGTITDKEDIEDFIDTDISQIVYTNPSAAKPYLDIYVTSNKLTVSPGFTAPENGSTDEFSPAEVKLKDGSVTLMPQIIGGTDNNYTYKWYKDGDIISGATGSTYTATEAGNYSVTVLDSEGASITLYWTVIDPTAPHTHTGVEGEFVEWTTTSGKVSTSGNYYLAEDITATGEISIPKNGTVTLCLNGHTLDMGSNYIVVDEGETLNICDCGNGGKIIGSDEYVVKVDWGSSLTGTLNLSSGSIVGEYVAVRNCGNFTMTGGSLIGGTASDITTADETNNTLYINSGASEAKAVISGGSIQNANSYAVYNHGSSLTLSGKPSITGSDNYADICEYLEWSTLSNDTVGYSGDILRIETKFINVGSVVVSGVTTGTNGNADKFTLTNEGYTLNLVDGDLVLAVPTPHTHDGVTGEFTEWTATSGELTSGNYYLTESNATALTDNITIPENATVNLCLNGKTLDMGSHYIINDGTLTICDCQETQGSIISTSYGIRNNGGTLTVTGGTVSSTGTSGKGIYNSGENTVTVSGGLVTGDTGIYNASTGTVTISGGNVNSKSSSAVYNYGKGSIVISGGTVKSESSFAIYNQKSGSIKVSDGEVISESIDAIRNASTANVEISGTAVVFGKRTGIYNAGGVITVTGGQVKANTEYGIWNYLGSVTISGGTVSTESLIGIYNESTGSVTVSDGTVIGSVAVYNYSGGSAEISGGTLTGTEYGVYNSGNGAIYLSGNPEISGSDDVYLNKGKLYAHANGDINDAYEGNLITIGMRSSFTNGVVVYEVNDNNEEKFSLSEGSTQTLVRVGDNLIVDGTAPTGEISIGTNHWNEFLNTITFGLFFKETQSVTITADDNLSGVKEIAYYLAAEKMSKEQLDALQSTDWTVDDEFNINPNNKYVIYARITDEAGNVTYISTDGIVLDNIKPVISGITDGKTYCGAVEVTVSDTYFDKVTVGGNEVTVTGGKFTVSPATGTQEIIAYDKAGNTTTYTITVNNGHTHIYGDSTEDTIVEKCQYCDFFASAQIKKPTGELVYNGSAHNSEVVYTGTLSCGNNLEISYGTATDTIGAGDYTASITLGGKTASVSYTVEKQKVTPPTINGKVYTGETQTADITDTERYTVTTNAGGKNVAAYDVVLTLKDGSNYKWDATEGVDGDKITLKFNITKATNEWKVNPAIEGWTYGGTKNSATGTAKFIEGDCATIYYDKNMQMININESTEAGDYYAQLVVAATDNFTGLTSEYLPFTIEKADLTITANNHSITYGDAPSNNGVTYSGFVNGETKTVLDGTLAYVYSYAQYDDIGDNFTITPKGLTAANYEITFVPGKLTVKPLMIEFDWKTLSPEDLVYDGNDKKIGTTVTNKVTSGQYDLWLLVEYHGDTKNVTEEGFYAQIKGPGGEKAHNYNVDDTAKSPVYKITKATPETNFPTGFNIDTDKKLSDIDLTGFDGYTWDAPDTAVEYDVHEYSMTFTPADTQNYKTVSKMIKVTGGDITAPTGEITLKDNKWNEFLNNITFGLFFKETQSIKITAADTESGVKEIAYYLATEELSIDDVKALDNSKWTVYADAINVEPDNKYVVYARITDNAGNIIYINSDGIVLDSIKPVIAGVEDGKDVYGDATFTVDEEYLDTVTLDGEPIEVVDGKYSVPADNKEHTIVVTDKTGNQVTYKLTVFKNYKVSFVVDGKEIEATEVGYGKDATLPEIPAKEGYTAAWDVDGKNITADTVITAVYEKIPESPQTGDNTNIWMWVALLFVSGISVFGIAFAKKRKEQEAE